MFEFQDAKKCCFCLPLRRGLLAVGYFKLVTGIGFTVYLTFITFLLVGFHGLDYFTAAIIIILFSILASAFVFDIIFIASAHMKNPKYIGYYYRYLTFNLVGYLVLLIAFIPYMIITIGHRSNVVEVTIGGAGAIIIVMALHLYFIYLVGSELRKLQLRTQFNFKNQIDEAECSIRFVD